MYTKKLLYSEYIFLMFLIREWKFQNEASSCPAIFSTQSLRSFLSFFLWLRKPNLFTEEKWDSDHLTTGHTTLGKQSIMFVLELRQRWVWFERTRVFSGIQFTKHFIEFVFVETNEVIRSNSNVILTQQTCGQRSRRVAGSKAEH